MHQCGSEEVVSPPDFPSPPKFSRTFYLGDNNCMQTYRYRQDFDKLEEIRMLSQLDNMRKRRFHIVEGQHQGDAYKNQTSSPDVTEQ
ncbi:hypothetical protein Hamer_G002598 [Homarus americanus]|uniref:Uncharacterized protein n=1 Tax=Homarus americanus TaxID=6706 RepID=A0A8J5MYR8_HOMAM|nr:hypothetical protein Hamer_G002598 [Homarus americanus]